MYTNKKLTQMLSYHQKSLDLWTCHVVEISGTKLVDRDIERNIGGVIVYFGFYILVPDPELSIAHTSGEDVPVQGSPTIITIPVVSLMVYRKAKSMCLSFGS